MKNRIFALLICMAVLVSAIGCGGSQKSDDSASKAEAVAEEAVVEEAPGSPAEEAVTEEVPASPAEEAAPEETPESPVDEALDEETSAENGEYDMQYSFVNLKYTDQDHVLVIPNGTVGDDTVLYNDKTLGGLCDYIDEKVLEEGRTINRPFLYDLVSVQIVDPTMVPGFEQFSRPMIYCLTIANEFHSIDVRIKDLNLDYNNINRQTFDVTSEGKEDSWIFDGSEKKFYLNGGSTEYTSSMFDAETLNVWSFVLEDYFGEN